MSPHRGIVTLVWIRAIQFDSSLSESPPRVESVLLDKSFGLHLKDWQLWDLKETGVPKRKTSDGQKWHLIIAESSMIIACIHGVSGWRGERSAQLRAETRPFLRSLFLSTPFDTPIPTASPLRTQDLDADRPCRQLTIGLGAQDIAWASARDSDTVRLICMQDIWTVRLDIRAWCFKNVCFVV